MLLMLQFLVYHGVDCECMLVVVKFHGLPIARFVTTICVLVTRVVDKTRTTIRAYLSLVKGLHGILISGYNPVVSSNEGLLYIDLLIQRVCKADFAARRSVLMQC